MSYFKVWAHTAWAETLWIQDDAVKLLHASVFPISEDLQIGQDVLVSSLDMLFEDNLSFLLVFQSVVAFCVID